MGKEKYFTIQVNSIPLINLFYENLCVRQLHISGYRSNFVRTGNKGFTRSEKESESDSEGTDFILHILGLKDSFSEILHIRMAKKRSQDCMSFRVESRKQLSNSTVGSFNPSKKLRNVV